MRTRSLAVLALVSACAHATDQPYRLPYENGVEIEVKSDHLTHSSPVAKMYDLRATEPGKVLVAAAPGWVREIKDTGGSSSSTNNYVWIEHPLDYCQPIGSIATGAQGASSCRSCPRGLGKCNEWTVYAHMERGSVRGFAGLTENEWVAEGQPIGIEGDVGYTPCAPGVTTPLCGRHVHFNIFEIDRDHPAAADLPTVNGDYEDYVDAVGRTERVPLFCTAGGYRLVRDGEFHVAAPCP